MLVAKLIPQDASGSFQEKWNPDASEMNKKCKVKSSKQIQRKGGSKMRLSKEYLFIRGLLALAIFTIACLCFAETHIAGDVNGTWNTVGSPYYITSNIQVSPGHTLLIMPGVEVIFQGHYYLKVLSGATLKAIGTESNGIVFTTNDSSVYHSGITFDGSAAGCSLVYCRIEHGNATGVFPFSFGGAILCYFADPVIENCEIIDNTAMEGFGGGIACYYGSPMIKNNTIAGNKALFSGGGVFCLCASPTIEANNIYNNWTPGSGGGIACCETSNPTIVNNKIHSNTADSVGGAIDLAFSCNPVIVNNTITGNSAGLNGGAITCSYSANPTVLNTIIWQNSSPDSSDIYLYSFYGYTCRMNIAYSNVDMSRCIAEESSEIVAGDGIVETEPIFSDSDFHPAYSSALIDAGAQIFAGWDSTIYAPVKDFANKARPAGLGW